MAARAYPGPSWADEGLINAGFEAGAVGEAPPGWILTTPKYRATIAADGQPPAARDLDAFPGFTGGVFVG